MAILSPGNLPPGTLFHGRYRIVRALKAGGMGAVYEAVDTHTESPRALKVMLPSALEDADQRARFALEARVTGNVESDHIVRVSDSGVDEASGSPFLVMDLLRGEDLGALLRQRRTLPPAEVVTYLTQAALALDKTHAAAVVHRDLKPQNLFLTRRDDGSPCVKILDFGIAKVVAQNRVTQTRALGTPLYMAPEQIQGEAGIGPRTDLYALGHVAYTLLAGDAYFRDESADGALFTLVTKILAGADEPPSARALRRAGVRLPPAFDAWFLEATALRPEARFGRATEQIAALAEALGPAARQPLVPAPALGPPGTAGPAPKGSRAILFAILGVGVLLAAGLAILGVSMVRGTGLGASIGCMPGATCASIDVPDPAHVDPQAILPLVHKIARGIDGHAALTMISATDVARDGTVDIAGDRGVTYTFAIPGAALAITVHRKMAFATKSSALPLAPAAEPRCSMKAAWRAAVSAGLPAGSPGNVTYSHVAVLGGSIWTITTGSGMRSWIIDGQTCAHRKY